VFVHECRVPKSGSLVADIATGCTRTAIRGLTFNNRCFDRHIGVAGIGHAWAKLSRAFDPGFS
jgi:hypothetical protein